MPIRPEDELVRQSPTKEEAQPGKLKKLGRSPRTSSAKQRLRLAKGARQAIVKNTGWSRGRAHAQAHLSYISRHGKIVVEDEAGFEYRGAGQTDDLPALWGISTDVTKQRDAYHIMLGSLPHFTEENQARDIARQVAADQFPDHHYAFAVHREDEHVHVHLIVNSRNNVTGKALQMSRTRMKKLRETYADVATEHGFRLAAATRFENGRNSASIDAQKGVQARKRGYYSSRDRQEIKQAIDRLLAGPLDITDDERKALKTREDTVARYSIDQANYARLLQDNPGNKAFQDAKAAVERQVARIERQPTLPSRSMKWIFEVIEARTRIMRGSKDKGDLALNRIATRQLGDARHFVRPDEKRLAVLEAMGAPQSAKESSRKAGEYLRLSNQGRASDYKDTIALEKPGALRDALARNLGKNSAGTAVARDDVLRFQQEFLNQLPQLITSLHRARGRERAR